MSQEILIRSDFEGLGTPKRGKVRDIYDLGESLLLVATDRISAFDVILPEGIPGKGYVLTQLSLFWLAEIERLGIRHHLITADVAAYPVVCRPYSVALSGRSMLVEKAIPLPVECIARGYLSGSGWKEYQSQGTLAGEILPTGLLESARLADPVFTPSTKAEGGKHDANLSFDAMKSLIGEAMSEEVRSTSLHIYKEMARVAEQRGIIIADTKMEFGVDLRGGDLMLIDELLTPDSSRFWPMDQYAPGRGQKSFDKQYVRDYLLSIPWSGEGGPPSLPPDVVRQTSQRYFDVLDRFTG